MNDYIVVIPARYNSKRLPGKPLIKIRGVPMIVRTYYQCKKVVPKSKIIVATDGFWDMYYRDDDESIVLNAKKASELSKHAEKKWKQEWMQIWRGNEYPQKFPTYDDVAVALFSI